MKRIFGILFFVLIWAFTASSQILEPVKWEFSKNKISDKEYELVFTAEIEDKWHLYSQDIPMTPPATVFNFEDNKNIEFVGNVVEESKAIEEYDKNFEMVLKFFAFEAVFKQKIKILTDGPVTVKGYLEYMCCDDMRCLPPTEEEFEFSFNAGSPTASPGILEPVTWNNVAEKLDDNTYKLVFTASIDEGYHLYTQEVLENGPLPTEFFFEESDQFSLKNGVEEESKAHTEFDEIFKMDISYFEDKAVFSQVIELKDEDAAIVGEIAYMVCNDVGCVALYEDFDFAFKDGVPTDAPVENATLDDEAMNYTVSKTMWDVIIEAILWGFVALLTPCVFPMVPMTISFFMKGGENKTQGRFQAGVFGSSIVLLYTIPIAVIILITYFVGGKTVTADIFNWLSTHWLPNILFFLIFMVFAASFLGMFEIVLPSWMVNRADSKSDKGGIMGAFFMALTLVLVSFSCTGPLVGTVLVKSAQGEIFEPIFAMLAFSIAFALPFTLFAFFPSWLQNLPKSGGWLNSVKVILGFIEIALGLKFLSVADQVYHWGILDREIYLAFWIVTFTLMGFYLLGKLKFAHDSPMSYIPVPRLALAIITFSFVVYLIPGMFGAPLKMLSGYLPPQHSHDFDLNEIIRQNAEMVVKNGGGTVAYDEAGELCESPKYSDFLHLPHGLKGYFDYEQALECAKSQGKPLFIDFTGHGCVNCREMEANVWSAPDVLKRLRNDFIVVALYVDDKTRLPEEEWVVSDYDGKTKKTIGKKFADFQISRFTTNAQPYYVLLDHNGKLLVEPKAYDLDVQKFVEFLDKGTREFEKSMK